MSDYKIFGRSVEINDLLSDVGKTHEQDTVDRWAHAEIERLQKRNALLEDVAVAAEKVVNEDDSYWNVTFDLNEPLDKLREDDGRP
jgi:hypothetical protein